MALNPLYQQIAATDFCTRAVSWSQSAEPSTSLYLKGAIASLPAFILRRMQAEVPRLILCLLSDAEGAAYLHSDLAQLGIAETDSLLFPPTGHTPYDQEQVPNAAPLIQRGDVLQQLADGFSGLLVTSIDALYERVPPAAAIQEETLQLAIGDELPPETLIERLTAQGFERTEFVQLPGDLAWRGGILDVFPFTGDYPIRIEFFGDEVDSLREFDANTQRSISRLTTARIVPNLERDDQVEVAHISLFDYLAADTLVATFDEDRFAEHLEALFQGAVEHYQHVIDSDNAESGPGLPDPASRYLDADAFSAALRPHARIVMGTFAGRQADETLAIEAKPHPAFHGNLEQLRRRILDNAGQHTETVILCNSRGQESRLYSLLEEEVEAGQVRLMVESIHEGFELPELGLALYTDHQIFNRYFRPTARKRARQKGGLTLRELQNLAPGDFVVHIDYGIGKFAGMEHITVRDKQQEAVRVLFLGGDTLYVNVNALHKLHKYTGKEGHQPRLTKLGSGQWERTKKKTKKRVKDIARDLIKLYAKRKASEGFAFSGDTVWQREMEVSFPFEDTPDQATAAAAVKSDMEESVPMDRLVCGDVGFGKTEVAVRAAFKAVQDGKQVAVLVPTTILAAQHHQTFMNRLDAFPVRIEMLSRFRTTAQQKEILARLKTGEVDIVIGTHRLTSKDVEFKNLGLLIIDEEQRFGVAVKERLRKLRVDVDTLTLTATPIPRTLQFSLLGARDLSIISTPPPNRQPIITEIHTFDQDLIRDAILYELSRGGQVFFIHNRVRTIEEMAAMVRAMVPDVRIQVAHGQMKPAQLERVMLGFIEKKFDVLISTSIIENGLDISNANTIIIDRADRFGLSELHQLRGRVGRSDRKAFCYLLVPSVHALTREGRQRLQAIEEFSDLGSGFNIAMRDLDIRGAGDMLGAEQSGFIADVGFETYHRILDEAVQELRAEEFSDLFDMAPAPAASETTVDIDEDAFIPESYLSNTVERLNLYRRISEAADGSTLEELRAEMADRFGPVPREVDHLLRAAEIKLVAQHLRLPKVVFKNKRLFLEIPSKEEDAHFFEHYFYPLLEKLNDLDLRYVLRETKRKKLRAIVQDVADIATAKTVLEQLLIETQVVS